MTDPRIAALAEALLPRFAARYGGEPFDELSWKMAREDAAALLAALRAEGWDIVGRDTVIEIARLRKALESIAANTCCDGCGEAARWARAALEADHD